MCLKCQILCSYVFTTTQKGFRWGGVQQAGHRTWWTWWVFPPVIQGALFKKRIMPIAGCAFNFMTIWRKLIEPLWRWQKNTKNLKYTCIFFLKVFNSILYKVFYIENEQPPLLYAKSSWITLTSEVYIFVCVFYVYGRSFSSWYLCILSFFPRFESVMCHQHAHSFTVNPLENLLLYSHMGSLRALIKSPCENTGGWKEKHWRISTASDSILSQPLQKIQEIFYSWVQVWKQLFSGADESHLSV